MAKYSASYSRPTVIVTPYIVIESGAQAVDDDMRR
jgi:hypothetical protein